VSDAAVVAEADSVTELILSATPPKRPAEEEEEKALVRRARPLIAMWVEKHVRRDDDTQECVISRAETELIRPSARVEPAEDFETTVRRACERAKKHVWLRLKAERLEPNPDPALTLGGRKATEIKEWTAPRPAQLPSLFDVRKST
jgi:hypothetical protein